MLLERCPKCDARIAPTDTECLDCGEDLVKHREELRKAATARKYLTDRERVELAQKTAQAAARGRQFGVDTSEETRLRTFDKHEAEKVRGEMVTAWVTAAIGLILGLVMLKLGHDRLAAGGGLDGVRQLSMPALRSMAVLFGETAMGLAATGIAIGSLLACVGQCWRAVVAHRSIAAVARGEKPEVVYIHPATRAGLIVASVCCPPAGLLFGILMKVSGRDEDTKSLGGTMLLASLGVIAILGLNLLWGLASGLKGPAEQKTPSETEQTTWLLAPWC